MGTIIYNGIYPIQIEAQSANSENIYIVQTNTNNFTLNNLEPNNYKLWAIECINNLDSTVYFSGQWEPYHRAARFAFYPDSIAVRSRWDIEGIIINID